MKHKCLSALMLALLGVPAGYTQVVLNTTPSRTVGHPLVPLTEKLTVYSNNPNLVEGRELYQPRGVALDTTVSPPILYVSDSANHRVLGWKNALSFSRGQKAELIIGQPDLFSTNPLGPATTVTTGLNTPTGIAVDASGNLWVVDSGNNRVLRFPKPASQPSNAQITPDLVVGQENFRTRVANFGTSTGTPNARGFYFSNLSGTLYQGALAFDPSGNLYVLDPGNRRVLAFQAADLTSSGPTAFKVIGQVDYTTLKSTLNPNSATSKYALDQFAIPAGIAFDSAGRLYVSDSDTSGNSLTGRVLVFGPQIATSNARAIRIYGIFPVDNPATNQSQLDHVTMIDPEGLFFLADGSLGVVDSGSSRILVFDSVDKWPTDGSAPQAKAVSGQVDFSGRFANAAASSLFSPPAKAGSLYLPIAAAFHNGELYVADTFNHRLVVLPSGSGGYFGSATRVLGQDRLDTNGPNLLEGREFNFQFQSGSGTTLDAGIAIDNSGDTPHLYVSDAYNHRVLGFRDLRTLKPGAAADIVIGQGDSQNFQSGLCNYPSGDRDHPNASSLCRPTGLLVDSSGNLYVADSLNGRVVRFPAPFTKTGTQVADLVLGKLGFNDTINDPSERRMSQPYGLAFTGTNGLLVSDQAYNRVLFFRFTGNNTFSTADSGKAAELVFGQPDFISIASGSGLASLNSPHHISTDGNGRVYIADSGNNRILIFGDPNTSPARGATAAFQIGSLGSPRGVFVSPATGEIWVTNSNSGTAVKYPTFDNLLLGITTTTTISSANVTLGLALDQNGDLFVADASNRVAIYYPTHATINAANGLTSRPLAPGMAASIYSGGIQFTSQTVALDRYPMPVTMADTQVLFNDKPVPLYFVSPGQINFLVPNGAPTSGTADILVVRASTGQVLSGGTVTMNSVSPGIFAIDSSGKTRRAAVLNQDGSVNDPTNPAARGSVISIYATGNGNIPNAPKDGDAASGLITTPLTPRIVIGSYFVDTGYPVQAGDPQDGSWVKYSGLAPGFAGLWQVNVQIPMGAAPGNQVPVAIIVNDMGSWDTSNPNNFITTIAVK